MCNTKVNLSSQMCYKLYCTTHVTINLLKDFYYFFFFILSNEAINILKNKFVH